MAAALQITHEVAGANVEWLPAGGYMRRIVMFDRVTADGYFASQDGKLDWVVPDDQIDKEGAAGIPATDTVLFGHKTYEMFASFWPHVADDSSKVGGPHGGKRSPAMLAMAKFLNEADKVVFSRTLKTASWKPTQIIREFDPGEIEAMKKKSGKDIIIFGSGSITSALTQHGLIDEYRFVVNPILLGSGRSLISGVPKISKLKLLEAKTYASGNVTLRYERAK